MRVDAVLLHEQRGASRQQRLLDNTLNHLLQLDFCHRSYVRFYINRLSQVREKAGVADLHIRLEQIDRGLTEFREGIVSVDVMANPGSTLIASNYLD